MKLKIVLLSSLITVLISCSKTQVDDVPANPATSGAITEAGYGKSNAPFSTAGWQLPAGIEMKDSIHEYSYCWAFDPFTQVEPKDWKGVPLGFSFCLTLKNSSTHSIIIDFPPQLVFVSSSVLHQNILTIQLGTVELAAGSAKTIVAQGFCINLGRDIPQAINEETDNFLGYSFGPATIPAALQEVVNIIKAKNITMADILKTDGTIDNTKAGKYAIIQAAIWEVTDKEGLAAATKAQLLAL